jgi:3-oxoacyl-[acyl-carrier-protein] synthase II
MMILERPSDARARKARSRARIVGYGATSDAYHVVKPHPHGTGLATAIRTALAAADAAPPDVSHVNAHGTGTQLGDLIEAAVLSRLLPQRPTVTSAKAVTGHLIGAAGAVEAALTALAIEHHLVPPTANLTTLTPDIDLVIPHPMPAGPIKSRTVHLDGLRRPKHCTRHRHRLTGRRASQGGSPNHRPARWSSSL